MRLANDGDRLAGRDFPPRHELGRVAVLVLASVQKAGPVGQKTATERIDATVVAARTAAEKHGLLVIMTSEMNRQGSAAKNKDDCSRGLAFANGSASIEYGAEQNAPSSSQPRANPLAPEVPQPSVGALLVTS